MHTDLSCTIGERLRAARHARGLSLSELARDTEDRLSKSRIGNYEQGLRRMGSHEARILAAALGNVSVDYLLCRQEGPGEDPGEERLLLLYRSAPPEQRSALIDAVHALVHPPPEHAPPDVRRPLIDPDTAQEQAAARWPDLILDRATYVSAPRIATWICRLHEETVSKSLRALLVMDKHPCVACRALAQRRAKRAERAGPNAEQYLALLASAGDTRTEKIFRLWLEGETITDIGRLFGITPQAVDQRIDTISKRLRKAGQGAD